MPYTLQCPNCGNRVFKALGTCTTPFEGEIDCTDWEEEAEVAVLHVDRYEIMEEDVDVERIECTECGKHVHIDEATAAYEAAYQEYQDSLSDPRQISLFP